MSCAIYTNLIKRVELSFLFNNVESRSYVDDLLEKGFNYNQIESVIEMAEFSND